MKIFDLHSDILYDLYAHCIKGNNNRFNDYHLPQLSDSIVEGGIWALYSPRDFDLQAATKLALSAIPKTIYSRYQIVLGFEGLRNLPSSGSIEDYYKIGFRHASLTWNEENRYATGVKGNPNRGLTASGRRLLHKMNDLDMIVDLAHLNEKSFYDVIAFGCRNIIFSHGNLKSLCNHPRNLSDDQLKALKEANGLLGLTLAGNFVAKNKAEQTVGRFLDHIDMAVRLIGIDNVAFGFDFMDYFTEDYPDSNLRDITDVRFVYKIVDGMRQRGYNEIEIAKITYMNFYNRYQTKIYRSENYD